MSAAALFALVSVLGFGATAAFLFSTRDGVGGGEGPADNPGNDGGIEGSGKQPEQSGNPAQNKAERQERRKRLRNAAQMLESWSGWTGYADFVDVAGLTESAWSYAPKGEDPFADAKSNKAIGPYQLKPASATSNQAEFLKRLVGGRINGKYVVGTRPDLLQQPEFAAAAIFSYFARTVKPGATWGDLRAAGAYPVFVNGRPTELIELLAERTKYKTLPEQQQRFDESIGRFERDLGRTGRSTAMVDQPAYHGGVPDKLVDILPQLGFSLAQLEGEA